MILENDFILGGATAAYQAEGAVNIDGKGKTYWDDYLKAQNVFDPGTASDFYHQYETDLKLAAEYGIQAIRISIAWSRIFPTGTGEVNPKGIAFYHRLIDCCNQNGVTPFVTLHHFDTPDYLYQNGDWLNEDTGKYFLDFAKVCFKEYGEKVKYWITINEPWSIVAGQYIIGHFPPNIHYDIPKAVQAMHHIMKAHASVVNYYKSLNLPGEIGACHILESKYGISEAPEDQKAACYEDTLANAFLLDATFQGRYSEKTMAVIQEIVQTNGGTFTYKEEDFMPMEQAAKQLDFIGMNYYCSHFLKSYAGESNIHHNGTGEKGSAVYALKGIGQRVTNPAVPTTDWDWPIYPEGLKDMLLRIQKEYPQYKKIFITENGMGYKDDFVNGTVDDAPRIDYIRQHLLALGEAMEKGVRVKGYFVWSLMDLFSWTNGYNKRYGLFYVDFETQKRTPKKSAYWIKNLSENKKL